jgi:hypothetical protein
MKCLAAVLCRTAMTDKETGLVSYVQTFNETRLPSLPAVLPPFWLGAALEQPRSAAARLRIVHRAPGGESAELLRTDELELPGGVSRLNFSFGAFEMARAGRHEFVLESSDGGPWTPIGLAPLYVQADQPPAVDADPASAEA